LGRLPQEIYRVKGLATVGEDGRCFMVNVTCGRVRLEIAPPPLARLGRTSLVVIGRRALTDHRGTIDRLLTRMTPSPAAARSGFLGLGRILSGGHGPGGHG